MAKLYWLKTIQPCKLELRPLTDYAGQPLIFTTPGTSFSRRCVTEEVRNSETVQNYVKRQMIADESVVVTQPATAVVATVKVAPVPVPATVVIEMKDEVSITEEPVAVTIAEAVVEATVEPVVETVAETVIETSTSTEVDSGDTRRNKRGRNR